MENKLLRNSWEPNTMNALIYNNLLIDISLYEFVCVNKYCVAVDVDFFASQVEVLVYDVDHFATCEYFPFEANLNEELYVLNKAIAYAVKVSTGEAPWQKGDNNGSIKNIAPKSGCHNCRFQVRQDQVKRK